MPQITSTKVSASSFVQLDGSNFTTVGVDNAFKAGNGNVSIYSGLGLTFDGKPASAIVDLKGSLPYGDSLFSGGFRIRNNIGEDTRSTQFRIQPCTINVPLGENVSAYGTPYVAAKVNHNSGKTNTDVGAFTGVSYNFKQGSAFLEVQAYDLTNFNPSTTSVNIGLSIKI